MKESVELKLKELQNKVEQNIEELTSTKLDTVIEGQENAESNAIKRSVDAESFAIQRSNNAEAKAVERAEYAESTADSRAYDNECIQWRIERLWKKRLVLCNAAWAVAVILLVLFVVNKIQDANDRNVLAVQKVEEELRSVQTSYNDGVVWFNSFVSHIQSIIGNDEAKLLEERDLVADVIDSMPSDKKDAWNHFASQFQNPNKIQRRLKSTLNNMKKEETKKNIEEHEKRSENL